MFTWMRSLCGPSEVCLFYGDGCVKKTDCRRNGYPTHLCKHPINGNTLKKNSMSESDAFYAHQTCSDFKFKGNTTNCFSKLAQLSFMFWIINDLYQIAVYWTKNNTSIVIQFSNDCFHKLLQTLPNCQTCVPQISKLESIF